jgi:lactoylglutathione lyase
VQYTIAMLGYGPEDKTTVLELTYNYGVTEYDKGNAYAQVSRSSSFSIESCEEVFIAVVMI